jgi:anti-sigma factor (TIGR02949 family)
MEKNTTHHCDQLISKVFLALDGEMSADEEKKFLDEINQCSCCLEKYQIEKSFKEFLSKKVKHECCFETLANSIKDKLSKNAIH